VSRAERVKSFSCTKAPLDGSACAKKKSRVHTRKEKDISHFFPLVSFIQQQSTKFIAQQTRKEKNQDSGEPRSSLSTQTHSYTRLPSPLIVVFAAARAEEAENAKRNAFERNFFVFQFCFVFGAVQSQFQPHRLR
jgi:hypothetical protein